MLYVNVGKARINNKGHECPLHPPLDPITERRWVALATRIHGRVKWVWDLLN